MLICCPTKYRLQMFEEALCASFNKHFPEKRIKVNKYKHKLSPWITSGIIKSIEFRDNLYKKLKACTTDSPEYELNQCNLKIYNGYLRQCIRAAKKQHYTHEFAKYKNDIRKTWDTRKYIMNKNKSKVEFPTYFLNNGIYLRGAKTIADKFNEYFTEIGPSLASEIDVSNKSAFNTYLTSPCTSFYFQYTNPSGILKIIQGLKPKTSAGYDHLSSKVLKDIANIVSTPLSIIINWSIPNHFQGPRLYWSICACASKGRPLLKALQFIAIFLINWFHNKVD